MKEIWSHHALKASEFAKYAAKHFEKAAELNDEGDYEQALEQTLLAVTNMDYSTQHAKQANEYCFMTEVNELPE
jgi:hypothetical protein